MASFTTSAQQDEIIAETFNRLKDSGAIQHPNSQAWFNEYIRLTVENLEAENIAKRGEKIAEAIRQNPNLLDDVETAAGL